LEFVKFNDRKKMSEMYTWGIIYIY